MRLIRREHLQSFILWSWDFSLWINGGENVFILQWLFLLKYDLPSPRPSWPQSGLIKGKLFRCIEYFSPSLLSSVLCPASKHCTSRQLHLLGNVRSSLALVGYRDMFRHGSNVRQCCKILWEDAYLHLLIVESTFMHFHTIWNGIIYNSCLVRTMFTNR